MDPVNPESRASPVEHGIRCIVSTREPEDRQSALSEAKAYPNQISNQLSAKRPLVFTNLLPNV